MRSLCVCLLISLCSFASAEENKAKLKEAPIPIALTYQKNKTATQVIETRVETEVDLPGLPMRQLVTQLIYADVTLRETKEEGALDQLEIILRRVKTTVQANEERTSFDTQNKSLSVAEVELENLMNRPLLFSVTKGLQLIGGEEWERIKKELPVATEQFNLFAFEDMAHYLFALKNEKLYVGLDCKQPLTVGDAGGVGFDVDYDVNKADLREVQASLSGRIEKKLIPILDISGLTLEGVLSGRATWQSQNALYHQVKVHQSYSGEISQGDEKAAVRVKVTHKVDSQPNKSA